METKFSGVHFLGPVRIALLCYLKEYLMTQQQTFAGPVRAWRRRSSDQLVTEKALGKLCPDAQVIRKTLRCGTDGSFP